MAGLSRFYTCCCSFLAVHALFSLLRMHTGWGSRVCLVCTCHGVCCVAAPCAQGWGTCMCSGDWLLGSGLPLATVHVCSLVPGVLRCGWPCGWSAAGHGAVHGAWSLLCGVCSGACETRQHACHGATLPWLWCIPDERRSQAPCASCLCVCASSLSSLLGRPSVIGPREARPWPGSTARTLYGCKARVWVHGTRRGEGSRELCSSRV